MNNSRTPDTLITEINITPLVDVCLVLVIIFMVTVPLMMMTSPVKVNLPEAKTIEAREDVNIMVAIDAQDHISVDEKRGNFADLPQLLKNAFEKKGNRMVIIRADKEVLHGRILEVMDLVKQVGGDRISLATVRKE